MSSYATGPFPGQRGSRGLPGSPGATFNSVENDNITLNRGVVFTTITANPGFVLVFLNADIVSQTEEFYIEIYTRNNFLLSYDFYPGNNRPIHISCNFPLEITDKETDIYAYLDPVEAPVNMNNLTISTVSLS